MGGIGKTTIASWLTRQDSCREQFELILWIPLGQDANVLHCQDLLLTQVFLSFGIVVKSQSCMV